MPYNKNYIPYVVVAPNGQSFINKLADIPCDA